ncbi:MAG: hypothetical protein ACO1OG_10580 [Devosia sp.]
MFIPLLAVLVVGAVVVLTANHFLRARRQADRLGVMERRVQAYMATVRRQAGDTPLNRMNDLELYDVLMSAAQNLRVQAERRWYFIIAGGFLAGLAAIAVGSQQGMQGFGIVVLVAAVALYGLNEFLSRRAREPLVAQGIEVERLRVE